MSKRIAWLLVALCLLLALPPLARAQQQEPPKYIFVAEWDIPRMQWAEYMGFGEPNARKALEKMSAEGGIVNWGSFSTVVHEEKGVTHGLWFTADSIAGIEKVRAELLKLPPDAAAAGSKHHDHLLRSLIHRGRTTAASSAYLWVDLTVVQPGKGQQWYELGEKYYKPTMDELLANGTISMYAVMVEQVHTENPNLRYVVFVTPHAEGIDKVLEAFAALDQKRSAEERRTMSAAFADVVVPGSHRDYFARVSSYWHK